MGPAVRYRPMSPNGSRMMDPMRASTGTVQLSSSYDPYDLTNRPTHAGYHPDVNYIPSYEPRFAREPRLEAQPISSTTYRDSGHSTKLRTEYAIRPRQRSNTASAVEIQYAPGRYEATASPLSRASPVIVPGHHRSPSPQRDPDRYVVPASSPRHHHPRHHAPNPDYASDTGRMDLKDRMAMARIPHNAYPAYEHSPRWRYPPTGGLRKGEDIDDYDAYSYTNPREQFEKDSAARMHRVYPRDRPLSLTGPDDPQLQSRKESRALGPPPSQRGFDRIEKGGRLRRSTHGSADSDVESSSARRQRVPVSLHQDLDEGYSSYRSEHEDHRHRRHRHRRHDDDRYSHDERSSRKSSSKASVISGTSTGLGTAVLGYPDDFDYELSPRTDHHRSHVRSARDDENRRHHSRSRRRRSRRRDESDSDSYTSDEDLKKYRREPSAHRRRDGSDASASSSDRVPQYLNVNHASRHRSHSRRRPEEISVKDGSRQERFGSPDELKKSDSAAAKDQEPPTPKGILKPPRAKFPEEPNPVREGVAPLKDAHKKGIPPGARWTKIDRRLVNPAALELGRERYEERSEYVIVLRVLTKEEIQAYAVKTQEIRDARHHEYIQERRRRREEDRRRGRKVDDSSSDDEDDGSDGSPLAIEASSESKSMPKVPADPAKAAA
ncbi:uncharacterized protein BO97DRAFT_353699 [Aspergillus homomorphus CBS 101889]|uniref:DUF8035 domain-containing protein n=1 Tax=Aspergillus homomorphus (strain CBS 101889) TaxID=1450537 RepID=A0A395HM65_ASPHC|nr:hypothetical protein BO97DRAFT_353699 [Aspergillus homomorphus CBS 101889]RAL08589.1 hypothetical protein BO97DRAFT_353699 [Aspergillus homomorphus CBS 101889]